MTSLITVLDHVFVPLTAIITITSVIGFLGNALAFYIFKFRFPPSGFNILMATLAVYDILACAIHMPLDIATFYDIGYLRTYLCKVTCFQLAFTATGAALILMSIAFVRFTGICKPLEPSFSTRSAYYAIVISVLLSTGIGLPITILFGDGELVTDDNVTARICAVEAKFMSTSGPISYYFILASLYVITFICHTCLYTKSLVVIWRRRQTFVTMKGKKNVVMMSPALQQRVRDTNRFQQFQPRSSSSSSSATSTNYNASSSPALARSAADVVRLTTAVDSPSPTPRRPRRSGSGTTSSQTTTTDLKDEESEMQIFHEKNEEQTQNSQRKQNFKPSPTVLPRKNKNPNSTNNNNSAASPVPLPRSSLTTSEPPNITVTPSGGTLTLNKGGTMSKNNNNNITNNVTSPPTSYRILFVVMAISVTYFLSYAPHFGVMFYLFTHDQEIFTASAQSLVFELLMRSFFLNNILDPVIYGLLSQDFRNEVRKLLLCIFSRNKS